MRKNSIIALLVGLFLSGCGETKPTNIQSASEKSVSGTTVPEKPASDNQLKSANNMSYQHDIAFHTCNLGDRVRKGTNPFTGEAVEFPIDNGLNESERLAVKTLLDKHKAIGPDEEDFYKITFSDQSFIYVIAHSLDGSAPCSGIALEFVGPVTRDTLRFAYRLSIVGNMSIGSSTDPDIVALVAEPQNQKVRKRWPSAPVLKSEDDFVKWAYENLNIEIAD